MWVQSLGQEDPLEEELETYSSFLPGENPMDRGAWQATVYRVTESWTQLKWLSTHACTLEEGQKTHLLKKHQDTKDTGRNFVCHSETEGLRKSHSPGLRIQGLPKRGWARMTKTLPVPTPKLVSTRWQAKGRQKWGERSLWDAVSEGRLEATRTTGILRRYLYFSSPHPKHMVTLEKNQNWLCIDGGTIKPKPALNSG